MPDLHTGRRRPPAADQGILQGEHHHAPSPTGETKPLVQGMRAPACGLLPARQGPAPEVASKFSMYLYLYTYFSHILTGLY
jgi:hypothetical protein